MKKQLEIENDLGELSRIRDEILEFIGPTLDALEKNRIVLSVDEAIANVIEHASKVQVNPHLSLEMEKTDQQLKFIIEDECEAFDPTSVELIDPESHSKKGQDRGLGIYLYRILMDASYQKREGKGNRLILKKQLKTN